MSKFIDTIVAIATREVGTKESPIGSNCGPRVNEYKAATNLNPRESWPWCAAFICWVVREAMKAEGVKETKTFKRPTTAGAYALETWSKAQDTTTATRYKPGMDVKKGDIITLANTSHVLFAVTDADPSTGKFKTVEGNTNDAGGREGFIVAKRTRHVSNVRCRIRFTI